MLIFFILVIRSINHSINCLIYPDYYIRFSYHQLSYQTDQVRVREVVRAVRGRRDGRRPTAQPGQPAVPDNNRRAGRRRRVRQLQHRGRAHADVPAKKHNRRAGLRPARLLDIHSREHKYNT